MTTATEYQNKRLRKRHDAGLCALCDKVRINETHCLEHAKVEAGRSASHRSKQYALGLCALCNKPRLHNAYCKKHAEQVYETQRERNLQFKLIIYAHYENKCNCCGEADSRFLTLDHVNNNGAEHRKELGGGGYYVWKWIIENNYPKTIQLLCWNCNCGKRMNNGVCPHKDKIKEKQK